MVQFYGFPDTTGTQSKGSITSPPAYILVKVDDKLNISISRLPPSVVPIAPVQFTYKIRPNKYVKLRQFPVTLAFAITDFKCQGQTFDWVLCDIHRPRTGLAPSTSPYVQLSRARSLGRVSIMRPFNVDELSTPLPKELLDELRWEEDMAQTRRAAYNL